MSVRLLHRFKQRWFLHVNSSTRLLVKPPLGNSHAHARAVSRPAAACTESRCKVVEAAEVDRQRRWHCHWNWHTGTCTGMGTDMGTCTGTGTGAGYRHIHGADWPDARGHGMVWHGMPVAGVDTHMHLPSVHRMPRACLPRWPYIQNERAHLRAWRDLECARGCASRGPRCN